MNFQVSSDRRLFLSSAGSALACVGCYSPSAKNPSYPKRKARAYVSRIVDSHVHVYDQLEGLQKTQSAEIPQKKALLPKNYLEEAVPSGVSEFLVIDATGSIDSNQWLLELAESEHSILGVVGSLPLGDFEFRGNLDNFSDNPLFKGIRIRADEMKNLTTGFVDDARILARKNLCVDIFAEVVELPFIVKLAEVMPELRIVIHHLPWSFHSDEAMLKDSLKMLETLATWPNVFAKLSGLVQNLPKTYQDADAYRASLDFLWETFGSNRLIYGSNWPICKHTASLYTSLRIFREYLADRLPEESEKFFWRNSRAAYGWKSRT